jgi:molybdenum cofactor synthesis domain-containing protein
VTTNEIHDGKRFKAAVITVSDKGSAGLREDTGGPLIVGMLKDAGYEVSITAIIPDEQIMIEEKLIECADIGRVDLIVTTGGTGFSVRDVTPEATIAVCQRLSPGIPEAMRFESLKITPRAMLSRAAAGIRGRTLIINLPGSPKAARENLNAVLPSIIHGLEMLTGGPTECAVKD